MTQEELVALCVEWQKILRLQDWNIIVKIVRERGMNKPDREGEITIFHKAKEANIRLLDPVDYPPTCTQPQDMEAVLVHELLHIQFEFCIDDEDNTAMEIAVELTAQALVNLKRKGIQPNG